MSSKRIAKTFGVTQLYRMFPTEDSCWEWLESVMWDGKPVCPHCGEAEKIGHPPKSKPHHYWCRSCRKHFTATTGTVMHSRRRPLQDWMYTIYSVITGRKGVSAMQLSKELDCHYRTAWYMLHRVREACAGDDFKLKSIVEVDETYIGGKEGNKHADKKLNAGRGTVGKIAVAGARERGGKVKAKPVQSVDSATLTGFVEDSAEKGAIIFTDDASAYAALPSEVNRYRHETVRHRAGEYARGLIDTNSIESVWAVLKRSIHGTWHHVSPKHLARYVNEAAFRLNEGNCEIDTIDRMESLVRRMAGRRISREELTADNGVSNLAQA